MKAKHLTYSFASALLCISVLFANDDPTPTQFEFGTRPTPQEIIVEIAEKEKSQSEVVEDQEITLHSWGTTWDSRTGVPVYRIRDFETDVNLIRISDGSQWKINPEDLGKMYTWKAEQVVGIEVDNDSWSSAMSWGKTYIYRLVNVSNSSEVRVLPFKGPDVDGPYYQVIGLQKPGLSVSLNDGSTWSISPNDAALFQEWALGDGLILGSVKKGWFRCCDKYDSILINVASNHYIRAKRI
jgi:hypothetical protein